MGGDGAQSGDFLDVINAAVAGVPWYVILLLVAMILTGLVLFVARLRANQQSGGGDLKPKEKGPRKPRP